MAKEFKVAYSTVHARVSGRSSEIKAVANQVIKAEERLFSLPVSDRVSAVSLIDDLRAISTHLAGAAKFGAMTAHKLSAIANEQSEFIDSAATGEENAKALKSVMALTKTANEAAATGLNLLSANKEITKAAHAADDPQAMTLEEFYGGKA